MIPEFCSKHLSLDELRDKLTELESQPLEGFYRFSDATEEQYVDNQPLPQNLLAQPQGFLYEAAFYCEGKFSISIRQYNDFWLWTQVDWKYLPPQKSNKSDDYIVSKMLTRTSRVYRCYTQYIVADNHGFEVLKPAWSAFIGFVKEDKHA